MANPRSSFTFQYNLTIKKSELDKLRYGRRSADNTLAPNPIFNPWTKASIMQHVINFYTCNKACKQLLVPTAVRESEEFFYITGKLRSANSLDDQSEHVKFIQNNDYQLEDSGIQLKSCWWELATPTLNLFQNVFKFPVRQKLDAIFKSVVTPGNAWKYTSKNQTAWFMHDSVEVLNKIAVYFEQLGFMRDDIIISSVEETKQPIILIKRFDIQKLNNAENFIIEQGRKMQP